MIDKAERDKRNIAGHRRSQARKGNFDHWTEKQKANRDLDRSMTFKCAICRDNITGSGIHIDHCHDTDVVRGLLCQRCNTGLGLFRDDTLILKWAMDYLHKHYFMRK